MLYIRMFISVIVSLYTSRVVLQTLGVEDYGIYGVVGGIVAMMGSINASMSGATSRFLTFELGRGDFSRLSKTFSSALLVHIIIAVIVLVLAETVGLWFLCNKLVIPEGRMTAAHWVYQLSILSAMLTITQVPYNSSIIAHEKMDIYCKVGVSEYWIVDWRKKSVEIYLFDFKEDGTGYPYLYKTVTAQNKEDLHLVMFPNLKITFDELFDIGEY